MAAQQNSVYAVIISTGTYPEQPTQDPTTPGCDLTIQEIQITKESAANAQDASLNIIASSSYYPLAYSLDNVTFQSSNIFNNLGTGNKTVYIKDPNGCTAERVVFIGTVANLLIADPSTMVEGNVSRWNAAFNPIVFKYQRKDFDVVNITNAAGKINVAINADLTLVNPNDLIYINTPNYEGTYFVISKTNNAVVLDCNFIIDNNSGFANINSIRKYYKLLTKINFIDNGKQSVIISTNTPNSKGITKADLSAFLQTLLSAKDQNDYTTPNYKDANLSASYQISYAESWEGQQPIYLQLTNPYYVLFAAGQLGQKMAFNLAEFVPFQTLTNANNLARWVTDFKEPVYTNGSPFDIGFIYSEHLLGLQIVATIATLDINRQPTGLAANNSFLQNENASYLLNEDLSRLIIASDPILSITGQPIPEQLGLNRLLINTTFPPNVYYLALTLKYGSTPVTKTQIIRINKDDNCNAVALKWIGLTGSWNYWQYNYNQQHDLDVQNSVIIKRFVDDWLTADTVEDVISKAASEKITVTAEDLSIDDIKGLRSIKISPKVMMLKDGKWVTVVVNTGTFSEFETQYGSYQFKITFSTPAINIQTQ